MVTESEGYETVKKALDELLTNTKYKRTGLLERRNKLLAPLETEANRLRKEMAGIQNKIDDIMKKMVVEAKSLDTDIALLTKEIERVEATKTQMAEALASRGKTEIAQKIEPSVVPAQPQLRCNTHNWDIDIREGCPKCRAEAFEAGKVRAQSEEVAAKIIEAARKKSKEFYDKAQEKPRGSQRDRLVGKKITGFVNNILETEAVWHTSRTLGKRLTELGYPAKYCELYAAKALAQLKWEQKAVSHSRGKTIYWRCAKTNIPFAGV